MLILDLNGVASLKASDKVNACAVYIYDDIAVMEQRLFERYQDDMDNPETQRRYNSRLRQNMIDYSEMPDRKQVFYAFTRNCSSVDACAMQVGKIFADFSSGVARDDDKIDELADSFRASVIDKM